MGSERVIPWSNLPKELVEKIGESLDTHIDVLRLRAVCTTWRASVPPFKTSPFLTLKLPYPNPRPYSGNTSVCLIESTVYLFQPLDGASSSSNGWLVKVITTVDGKLRVMNPLTYGLIKVFPKNMPKVLDLLDFRVTQVSKAYHLQNLETWFPDDSYIDIRCAKKVLLVTNHARSETDDFSLMVLDNRGNDLFYLRSGDEKWSKLKDSSCNIVDVIVFEENFYVVDKYGETMKFDSSFNETKVSSRLYDGDEVTKKHLVESCGQLFLVDMILNAVNPHGSDPLEIKIYLLDEEQEEWIEEHTLGNRIFFAGNNCGFSISSQDFGDKCGGNRIYYGNEEDKFYEEDSDKDMGCCCCGFSDNTVAVRVDGYDNEYSSNDDGMNERGSDHDGINERGSDDAGKNDHSSNDDNKNVWDHDEDDKNERNIDEDDKNERGCDEHDKNEHDNNDKCSPGFVPEVDGPASGFTKFPSDDEDDENEHGHDDLKNECDSDNNSMTGWSSDDDGMNERNINDYRMNEHGNKSGGLSEELILRYKGLYGHNTGVFTLEDGKLRSLSSSLEYADIFWPPSTCLNLEDPELNNARAVSIKLGA